MFTQKASATKKTVARTKTTEVSLTTCSWQFILQGSQA